VKPVNLSIKENQRITHNSIFADFAHSGFPRRVCCLKPETKLSKINRCHSGTEQSPTLVNNLTKIGSTLSPEELRSTFGAGPLIAEHIKYTNPVVRQSKIFAATATF